MITATERIESIESQIDIMKSQVQNITDGLDPYELKTNLAHNISFFEIQVSLLKNGYKAIDPKLKLLQKLAYKLEETIRLLDRQEETSKSAIMKVVVIKKLEERLSFLNRLNKITDIKIGN